MVYAGCIISFYRLFDLNGLVEVAHYMSYKQIVYGTLLGHSASSNQHLKFLQHSVANYLIPNIHQSNWTKLKIPYSHYKFGSSIDGDIGFKIIGNKFQNNESNIGTIDELFGLINFLQKPVNDVGPKEEAKPVDEVEKPVNDVGQLRKAIANWLKFYNNYRPHSTFAGLTPQEVYYGGNSNALKPKNNKFAA